MVNQCSICKSRGEKGYFRYPKEGPQRGECLKLAGLPAKKDLKVKVENLRICSGFAQTRILRGEKSTLISSRTNDCITEKNWTFFTCWWIFAPNFQPKLSTFGAPQKKIEPKK